MEKKEIITIVAIIIVVMGLGIILSLNEPETSNVTKELKGQEYELQSAQHIEPGEEHEPYNSNPPTSGPHWANPAQIDFYEETLPDEQLIHNLEHGQIWISYREDLGSEGIAELRNIQSRHRGSVIVTRRETNDSKIAVASWGRLMNLDEVDIEKIEEFIRNNKNNSPEPFAR